MKNYEIIDNKIHLNTINEERVDIMLDDIVSIKKIEHPSRLGYSLGILIFIILGLIFIVFTNNNLSFLIFSPLIVFCIYKINTISKNILGLRTKTDVLYRIDLKNEDINEVIKKIKK